MMSENLEQSEDVGVLTPQEVEPPREEDGHCPLPFRWETGGAEKCDEAMEKTGVNPAGRTKAHWINKRESTEEETQTSADFVVCGSSDPEETVSRSNQ